MISHLDKGKYNPIVVIPDRNGNSDVRNLFIDAGAEVVEEKSLRPFHGSTVAPSSTLNDKLYSLCAYPPMVCLAKKLVNRYVPDIVHLNSTCMIAGGVGAKLANPKVPVIAHVREPLLSNRWGRLLAAMNRRTIDHFISIDRAGLQSLGSSSISGEVIFNFVDTTVYQSNLTRRASERLTRAWKSRDVVFLLLSRVAPSNGALEFMRTLAKRRSDIDPRAKFVVAGFETPSSDYMREALNVIETSDRYEAVAFTLDVVGLLDAADVLVAPFTTSHSARCIFEGASMGKPGLITRLPNLQELIREGSTGLSYDLADEDELVSAINRLCDDNTRANFSAEAVEFGLKEFSAKVNISKIMETYDKLVSSHI